MKRHVQALLEAALDALREDGELDLDSTPEAPVKRSRGGKHGDFASPIAMALARGLGRKPRDIAAAIVERLPASDQLARVELAGPGFINFHMHAKAFQGLVHEIVEAGAGYGCTDGGGGRRVQVEFVSANPTGPLHVGHGRGAAYGAVVANLLEAVGYTVQREYYVNDDGRQMDILGISVWLRYLALCGEEVAFPSNGYQGEYIRAIASALAEREGTSLQRNLVALHTELPGGGRGGENPEAHIDVLIERARELLGAEAYRGIVDYALETIVENIRSDLQAFGVVFDNWFSERALSTTGAIARAIERLRERDQAYDKDGAVWFRSSTFGDEKDRVMVRENGETTYFASDIAYHMEKFERGFERVIDVWGADHHGYVARVKGALAALGGDPDKFDVLLVQFAHLYKGGEKLPMSTRSGEFVPLEALRQDVGTDAARFFYVMRRCEQHLDFDLELAKSRSNENPVYYVQYAHARIASVMRQCEERGYARAPPGGADAGLLNEPRELDLLRTLSRYPEVVAAAADALEPHQLTFYLRELATDFHAYYNAHTILAEEERLRDARLALAAATRRVLINGLELLGVSAPDSM